MLTVGLTGGIGCGKSLATAHFARLGTPIVDADEITRELTRPGASALVAIEARFGSDVITPGGELNRRALRTLVFADAQARKDLEGILHPAVRATIKTRLADITAAYCIVVIPLLVETGMEDLVDRVLVIDCLPAQQIARVMQRDACTEAQAQAMLAAQATRAVRLASAEDILANISDVPALQAAVDALHHKYLGLTKA